MARLRVVCAGNLAQAGTQACIQGCIEVIPGRFVYYTAEDQQNQGQDQGIPEREPEARAAEQLQNGLPAFLAYCAHKRCGAQEEKIDDENGDEEVQAKAGII